MTWGVDQAMQSNSVRGAGHFGSQGISSTSGGAGAGGQPPGASAMSGMEPVNTLDRGWDAPAWPLHLAVPLMVGGGRSVLASSGGDPWELRVGPPDPAPASCRAGWDQVL